MNKISVLIADDMIIALEGLKRILQDIGDIELVAFASTPEQVIEISGKIHPNVIVLDMNWYGDQYAGIKLIRELRLISPKSTIIANSAYIKLLDEVKNEGVEYILSKSSVTRQVLVETIREAGSHSDQSGDVINVLFAAADPTDATRLRLGEELREIQEKIQLAKLRKRFVLHQRMSLRPSDFSQALLDIQPQILHFSGHGTSNGELCFENSMGKIHPVQPNALNALFAEFKNQVNCVILNACYSKIQAESISQHVDYVIGMSNAIGDKAAIAFAIGFYQALGAGRTIEQSYNMGCVQIQLQNIPEHLTPIIIRRSSLA